MRVWLMLLGGMGVWFAHFLTLYAIASIFGTNLTARAGVALATIASILADAALLAGAIRMARSAPNLSARWSGSLGTLLTALSLLAVSWQALPALIG